MAANYPKRPRDQNQLAKHIVDLATSERGEDKPVPDTPPDTTKRRHRLNSARNRQRRDSCLLI